MLYSLLVLHLGLSVLVIFDLNCQPLGLPSGLPREDVNIFVQTIYVAAQ